jgi:energy-coupling factor transporter transmembrane protein EcfT
MAMVSRGYTGNPKTLTAFRIEAIDRAFALACLAGAVLALGGDHLLGR